jgi:acetyl esterase/lipase
VQGPAPWDDLSFYAGLDPKYQANRVATPTLIVTGSQDIGSPEAMRMHGALKAAGAASDLIVYNQGDHILVLAERKNMFARALEFFVANIAPSEPHPYPTDTALGRTHLQVRQSQGPSHFYTALFQTGSDTCAIGRSAIVSGKYGNMERRMLAFARQWAGGGIR